MKKIYLGTILIILLVGLLGTGCSGEKADLTKGKTPEQIIKEVNTTTGKLKNYSFEAYIHSKNDTNLKGAIISDVPSNEYYEFYNNNNVGNTFDIYMRGSTVYIQTNKNSWEPIQEDIVQRGTLEYYLYQVIAANPTPILSDIFKNRVAIKRLKDERIEGKNTAVIEITYDLSKSGKTLLKKGNTDNVNNAVITLWVGKNDLLVYRYYTEGIMEYGNKKTELRITTNVTNFNKTKIPIPKEIKKLQVKL